MCSSDLLFTNVVAKCTESQINFAINRSIENQGDLFVGGLQQRKEMKELDDYLIASFPNIDALHRSKLVTMMVKSRILPNQSELITQVIESENALDFLEKLSVSYSKESLLKIADYMIQRVH